MYMPHTYTGKYSTAEDSLFPLPEAAKYLIFQIRIAFS